METGRVIGGKYRLEREIARGGMGSVWLARHDSLDVDVAIKVLAKRVLDAPKALERFRREARAAARLRSPHIVHIYDYGVDDGFPFMAMELLEGSDLRAHLEADGPLSLERTATILRPIGKALRIAHDAGLVHRDLKPANVFLALSGDDEIVKILDFGIAKELHPAPEDSATASDVLLGTPAYMSPEQARGGDLDARSDLWSLGVIVFEMLTGQNPFRGNVLGDIFAKIGWDRIPAPSEIMPTLPPAVDDFMARALSRDLDGRFSSATAMVRAFEAVVEGRSLPADESDRSSALPSRAPPSFARDDEPTADVENLGSAPTEAAFALLQDDTAPPTTTPSPSTGTASRRWVGLAAAVVVLGTSLGLWQATRTPETVEHVPSEVAPEPEAPAAATEPDAAATDPPSSASASPAIAADASPNAAVDPAPEPAPPPAKAQPGVAMRVPPNEPQPRAQPKARQPEVQPKQVAAAPADSSAPSDSSAPPAAPPATPDPIFGVKVPK